MIKPSPQYFFVTSYSNQNPLMTSNAQTSGPTDQQGLLQETKQAIIDFFGSDLVLKQKYPPSMDSVAIHEHSWHDFVGAESRRLLTMDQVMTLQTTCRNDVGSMSQYLRNRDARVYKAWRFWCLKTISKNFAEKAIDDRDYYIDEWGHTQKNFEKVFSKAWSSVRDQSKYKKLRKAIRDGATRPKHSILDYLPEQEFFDPSTHTYQPGFYDYELEQEQPIAHVQKAMAEAVKFLDFEMAAKLRDKLISMESSQVNSKGNSPWLSRTMEEVQRHKPIAEPQVIRMSDLTSETVSVAAILDRTMELHAHAIVNGGDSQYSKATTQVLMQRASAQLASEAEMA